MAAHISHEGRAGQGWWLVDFDHHLPNSSFDLISDKDNYRTRLNNPDLNSLLYKMRDYLFGGNIVYLIPNSYLSMGIQTH